MTHEEVLSRVFSADDFDYSTVSHKLGKKVCAVCGKEFYPFGKNSSRQRFCKRTHFMQCVVCGKAFELKTVTDRKGELKCTCSRKCTIEYKAQKTKAAMVEKYGVENPSQVPEFQAKAIESIKAKQEQTNEKIRATLTERYGGIGTASPILRQKIESTMQERYGVTNPDEVQEFRDKIRDKLQSPETIQRKIEASRLKYNTDYPSQSEIVQLAMQETCMRHYGVKFSGQIPESREKAARTCEELYGVPYGFQQEDARKKAIESLAARPKGYRISQTNLRFEEFMQTHKVQLEREEYLGGSKSADFKVSGTNILIEVDPAYTHSDLPNHWGPGKPASQQLDRTLLIESKGYRCVHVFDWDDWGKVASMFSPKQAVYARNCQLQAIDPKSVDRFLDKYHLQGKVKGTEFAYGLVYRGELIAVMTFGKPRYNKNYEWELLRLCTHADYRVVGGASRMFKQFVKEVNSRSIISYCDRAKFTGEVYLQLGFTLHHASDPAKVWSKDKKYVTDNYLRAQGADRILGTDYGKGTDNEAIMIRHGWRSVYDCGQYVFEWKEEEI